MSRWDDDDWWDDRADPPHRNPRSEPEPPEPIEYAPVREALEGAVYMVADALWGFRAPDRTDHPGICVRCVPYAGLAFLFQGTDHQAAKVYDYPTHVVEPSPENGLGKPTAFAFEPRRMRLHKLRSLHSHPRLLGRLADADFVILRRAFEALGTWATEGRA